MTDAFESLFAKLGLPVAEPGDLIPGTPPEPVSEERIRAFQEGVADEFETEKVAELIAIYQEWHNAALRLVEEEYFRTVANFSRAIRGQLDARLAPYLNGEQPLADCNLVAIVAEVQQGVLGPDEREPDDFICFFDVATEHIDDLMKQYAERRLAGEMPPPASPASSETEFAVQENIDTVFVGSNSDAERLLLRQREREQIKEYAADAIQYESFARFVDNDRIAEWFGVDVNDVADRISFVRAKLALADERGEA